MTIQRRIVVTEPDLQRLRQLIAGQASGRNARECDALATELDRADVVQPGEIPSNVVTMNSRARFVDERTGEEMEMTLVYPRDADLARAAACAVLPLTVARTCQ